jgi:hypothetical protein
MPTYADFFSQEAFDMLNVTSALNKMPYQERRLGQLNLFGAGEGVETDKIEIDEQDGILQIVGTSPRGAPGTKMASEIKRKARLFKIPHMLLETRILPSEIQNDRRTGEIVLESAVQKVNNKLAWGRQQIENTFEIHRLGALKGLLVDADGSTLYDFNSEFETTAETANIALSVDTTSVREEVVGHTRTIEDNLGATGYSGLRAICGRDFFDALTSHERVRDTYLNWEAAQSLREDLRSGFPFGGVIWEEYRGMRGLANDIGIVAANKAILFPEGVDGMFRSYFAPADFMGSVNMMGEPWVAKVAPDRHADRFVDIMIDSNPLFMNTRPNCVVELTAT